MRGWGFRLLITRRRAKQVESTTFLGIELDAESELVRLLEGEWEWMGMDGKIILHEEGAALPHWSAATCMLCGEARKNVSEADEQPVKGCKGTSSPHQAKQVL